MRHFATSRKIAGSIPDEITGYSMDFFRPHYEYQEYFLGVKTDDNLATFVCRLSRNPGCLKILEP